MNKTIEAKSINDSVWSKIKSTDTLAVWTSEFYSSDGDYVIAEIDLERNNLYLYPFSGSHMSHIYISQFDLDAFYWKPNKVPGIEKAKTDEERFLYIANYFCKKFCNHDKNSDNAKKE